MKLVKYAVILLSCALIIIGCSKGEGGDEPPPPPLDDGNTLTVKDRVDSIAKQIWDSSPINPSDKRKAAIDSLQKYFDGCSSDTFSSFLKADKQQAKDMEEKNPALWFYWKSYNKVLKELRDSKPEEGEVYFWLLYNMGYIVKTSKVCFGIDISHKYAEDIAEHLDFLLLTHHHYDHYSQKALKKMQNRGKTIVANADFRHNVTLKHYLPTDLTKDRSHIEIDSIHINSFTVDHYYGQKFYVSTFEVALGKHSGNLNFMHIGDSNYDLSQFTGENAIADKREKRQTIYAKPEDIQIVISRCPPPNSKHYDDAENKLFNSSVLKPKYVFYSHFNELGHKYEKDGSIRWFYPNGFARAKTITAPPNLTVCIPIWGDKMVWKNGVLQ